MKEGFTPSLLTKRVDFTFYISHCPCISALFIKFYQQRETGNNVDICIEPESGHVY